MRKLALAAIEYIIDIHAYTSRSSLGIMRRYLGDISFSMCHDSVSMSM